MSPELDLLLSELKQMWVAAGSPTIVKTQQMTGVTRPTIYKIVRGDLFVPQWKTVCRFTDGLGGDRAAVQVLWEAATARAVSKPLDELKVMALLAKWIDRLDDDAQQRLLRWLFSRYHHDEYGSNN